MKGKELQIVGVHRECYVGHDEALLAHQRIFTRMLKLVQERRITIAAGYLFSSADSLMSRARAGASSSEGP